jgi:membrane protein YdbS with pleckstrin-like domain
MDAAASPSTPERNPPDELDAFVERHRRRVVANVSRTLAWPAALFVLIAVAVAIDIAVDVSNGVTLIHVALEIIALLVALVGVVITGAKLKSSLTDGEHLLGELEVTTIELNRWRAASRFPNQTDSPP